MEVSINVLKWSSFLEFTPYAELVKLNLGVTFHETKLVIELTAVNSEDFGPLYSHRKKSHRMGAWGDLHQEIYIDKGPSESY